MNDTNDDTNMTGNADNRSILRTKCGQGINQGEHAFASIGFHSRDQAIDCLCQKVFGATPFYADQKPGPSDTPELSDETLQAIIRATRGRYGRADLDKIAQDLIDTRRKLTEAREELAATRKDYMCLAERLDGHDATECRANLDRLIETNRQLVTACKQLMKVIGSPDDPPEEWWATEDEINDAWNAGSKALEAVKGGDKC